MQYVLALRLWAKTNLDDKKRGWTEAFGAIASEGRFVELVRSFVELQIRRRRLSQIYLGLSEHSVTIYYIWSLQKDVFTNLFQADEAMTNLEIQAKGKNYLVVCNVHIVLTKPS